MEEQARFGSAPRAQQGARGVPAKSTKHAQCNKREHLSMHRKVVTRTSICFTQVAHVCEAMWGGHARPRPAPLASLRARRTRTPHPLSTSFLSSFLNWEEISLIWGRCPQYPWDLPRSGQQYGWWARRNCPTLSALESALGSHPCVALSSAQAFP